MASSATPALDALLTQLDRAQMHYGLARIRDGAVMVSAAVPGRRYEIEGFADGRVDVEVFSSEGRTRGHELVDDLLTGFTDGPEPTDAP